MGGEGARKARSGFCTGPAAVVGFLASLRLTVVCLALAMVLVFLGTLVQVDIGIYAAQARFFRSFFVYWPGSGSGPQIPVFPGGYLIGGALVVNLVCAHALRFGFRRDRIGLLMVHAGLILLLLGQLATDLFSQESMMRLAEGETKPYSEDARWVELAILETSHPEYDEVVAISERALVRGGTLGHASLPFAVQVLQWLPNSISVPATNAPGPLAATHGVGLHMGFVLAPPEAQTDRRNIPSAYVKLVGGAGPLGVWAVSLWTETPQKVVVGSKSYELVLRLARHYKPFAIELIDFAHDKYLGTDIPRNFSSDVRVIRPDTGEHRSARIFMNNPLRYGGETFYQSGFDERDPRVTILQVVRNPSWPTPYVSCTLVGVGLAWQFLTHLLGFLRGRSA